MPLGQQPLNKLTYSYDSLGRLIQANAPYGGGLSIAYDYLGNRTTASLTAPVINPGATNVASALPKRQQGDFNTNAMMVALESPQNNAIRLVGWGNSNTGALANNYAQGVNAPAQVALFDKNTTMPPGSSNLVDWAFTNANLYVVYPNGWVYSAGRNDYGQLGHGDTVARPYLKRIEYFIQNNISITKVWAAGSASLSYGGSCVYFQASDGRLFACGANQAGNLGNASTPTSNVLTPAPCAGVDNISYTVVTVVVSAVSGNFSAYLLCSDGRLLVAGYNGNGQLGVGTTNNVTGAFVRALQTGGGNLANVMSISAAGSGAGSALVVDASGFIWATGYNGYGQLGLGDTNNRTLFTQLAAPTNVAKAEIGGGHGAYCYAQDIAGVFYTWGYNGQNNLFQNNTSTDHIVSATIAAFLPDAVAKVYFPKEDNIGGNAQMIILTVSGRLAYAGVDNGQIGISNSLTPAAYKWIPVPEGVMEGLEAIVDVFVHGSGGNQRLFVITNLGSLYASGDNNDCVCTAGYSSNNRPGTLSWYRVPLPFQLLSC